MKILRVVDAGGGYGDASCSSNSVQLRKQVTVSDVVWFAAYSILYQAQDRINRAKYLLITKGLSARQLNGEPTI